jgi:hypothetical protein
MAAGPAMGQAVSPAVKLPPIQAGSRMRARAEGRRRLHLQQAVASAVFGSWAEGGCRRNIARFRSPFSSFSKFRRVTRLTFLLENQEHTRLGHPCANFVLLSMISGRGLVPLG